jgi:2-amino-4-hydroxy-6-hydroxymethyldihydropteridine diphosphokinase
MKAAIGLGTSMGPRRRLLERAVWRLARTPGLELVRVSRWVSTPPLRGGHARGHFLNGVALFEAALQPEELLARCVALERAAGRRRARRWGDRTLDLDVLLVEGQVWRSERLILPHPAIADRPFVLEPLLEVWPDAVDPVTGAPWASYPTAPGPRPHAMGLLARRRPLAYL